MNPGFSRLLSRLKTWLIRRSAKTYRAVCAGILSLFWVSQLVITSAIGSPLFTDDFTRAANPGVLAPWSVFQGTWAVTNGVLRGASPLSAYGNAYIGTNWTNYAYEARVQLPAGSYSGGIGGRLAVASGTHYAARIFPEGSAGGSSLLKLMKFTGWSSWSGTPMQQVSLPSVGTNFHTLKLGFVGNRILVSYDGTLYIDVVDSS